MDKKHIAPIAIVLILLVLGAGFWYWQSNKGAPSPLPQTKETLAPTLGGTIAEQTQNPVKGRVPDANPFEGQKNPFDAIYQNPFK